MGQQWVGGRATLSQEYPHPALDALCPLIPYPLLFYFPRCLITNVPPAKWSRCLGPFPYCPGLSFLDAKLAGFLGSPLCSQMSPTAPP